MWCNMCTLYVCAYWENMFNLVTCWTWGHGASAASPLSDCLIWHNKFSSKNMGYGPVLLLSQRYSIYVVHTSTLCMHACWEYIFSVTTGWIWGHGVGVASRLSCCWMTHDTSSSNGMIHLSPSLLKYSLKASHVWWCLTFSLAVIFHFSFSTHSHIMSELQNKYRN